MAALACVCGLVPIATWGTQGPESSDYSASPAGITLTRIASESVGLKDPWGATQLPDGSWLVTSRSAVTVTQVAASGNTELSGPALDDVRSFVFNPPQVEAPATSGEQEEKDADSESTPDEAGLYGIAVSPQYSEDGYIYAFASNGTTSRIYRLHNSGNRLWESTVIVDNLPAGAGRNGGALGFGSDGYLYASIGDAGKPRLAGDLESLAGKIIRLGADGSYPATNPLTSSLMWSAGHRNVTGFTWSADGVMLAVEPGADFADELNVIQAGHNYGWPDIEGAGGEAAGYTDPAISWLRTDSHAVDPSGVAVTGEGIYVASYSGERMWRYQLTTAGLGQVQSLEIGANGRLGAIAVAYSGDVAVLTANSSTRSVHTAKTPYDLLPPEIPTDGTTPDTDAEKDAQAAAKARTAMLKAPDRIVTYKITP